MSEVRPTVSARRIIELDLLRGFFIVIIILDHLQFWPSPWQYVTGQGRLWVSAAEGFFLISGLLIGYLRAYKGHHEPLKDLAIKLWKRAGMLYVWCVVITFAVVGLTYLIPGNDSLLPKLPDQQQLSSMGNLVWSIVSTQYASDWIYFLRLYAIMLALTPLFLWLVRIGKWWVFALLSLGIYAISLILGLTEASMQWQILFFGAGLIGWKLETILAWLRKRRPLRTALIASVITFTLATMALSYFMVHGWSYVESPATSISREAYVSVRANVDPLFSNNPLEPPRILLSFIWFVGLLALFHVLKKYIVRFLSWILTPFGTASLTAYCLQALVLAILLSFMTPSTSMLANGLVGLAVLLLVWGLLKIPIVTRILPR